MLDTLRRNLIDKPRLIIIGLGSAGRKYAESAIKLGWEIYAVDPKFPEVFSSNLKGVTIENKIEDLPGIDFDGAVISNYARDRISVFLEIKERLKKFCIFEKPLSDSIVPIFELEKLVHKSNLNLLSHHRWSILGLSQEIQLISRRADLGEMVSFELSAGNCDLAAGGLHWIGFSLSLYEAQYGSIPKEVVVSGNIQAKKSNPRSKELNYLSGRLSFCLDTFDCEFNFHEASHIAPNMNVIFQKGAVKWDFTGEYNVSSIDTNLDSLKPYQYKVAKNIENGELKCVKYDPFEKIMLAGMGLDADGSVTIEEGILASKILLAGMVSCEKKSQNVSLKDLKNISKPLLLKSWNFT